MRLKQVNVSKKVLTCESHQHRVVYESLKCHIFFLSKGLVSLNQRENATLHPIHMCNVIDTIKTFSQKLKALLREWTARPDNMALSPGGLAENIESDGCPGSDVIVECSLRWTHTDPHTHKQTHGRYQTFISPASWSVWKSFWIECLEKHIVSQMGFIALVKASLVMN